MPGAYAASVAEVRYREAALLQKPIEAEESDRVAASLDASRAGFLDMMVAQELGSRTAQGQARLARAIGELQRGLRASPADAYGWTRLAAALVQTRAAGDEAAWALSVALQIAPHDRKLGALQFDLAVVLWPRLSADGREALTRRARFIAGEPTLKAQAQAFAVTALGQSLLGHGRAP